MCREATFCRYPYNAAAAAAVTLLLLTRHTNHELAYHARDGIGLGIALIRAGMLGFVVKRRPKYTSTDSVQ